MKLNIFPVIIAFLFTIQGCMSQENIPREANQLIHENSPYLLQHAYNPVNWYPWGQAALDKAKVENKLIIISIGYAACHWCHVMEHESFEDSIVADQMNENFVSIKVDREERPDIDDVYMTACQLSSGRGCGWPLNAFALPDGRPVWAGTYFPKDQWLNVLVQFQKMWQEEPEKLNEYATQITHGISQQDKIIVAREQDLSAEDMHAMAAGMIEKVDKKKGGRKGAPKFPMPNNYQYLLTYHKMTGNAEAMEAVKVTLDNLAFGGIYDQLGGGFARYSVDADWFAPHFEKMLYDNGQLLSLYSQTFQLTKNPLYKSVISETVDWLRREMTNPSGGFYSSLDADSEGEEGKFYVWTEEEITQLLDGQEQQVIRHYYNIKTSGNWEHGKNILYRNEPAESVANKLDISIEEFGRLLQSGKNKLFQARSNRVRPGLDDKILTSWNALMLGGLLDAYRSIGEPLYLEMALKNALFIKENLIKEGYRLDRNYKDGNSKINGFLDDYALLADAFLKLYEVTFDEKWIYDSKKLTDYAIDHFFDQETQMFHFTSDLDPPLVARKKELGDNVIPGSNSVMGRLLNKMSHYFYEEAYVTISNQLLYNMIEPVVQSGQTSFYSNWALLFLEKIVPTYEIAIVGDDYENLLKSLQRNFIPNAVYMGGKNEGTLALLEQKRIENQTTIYICQNQVCQLPVQKSEEALRQITYF